MIKHDNSNINDWFYDASDIIKVYHNGAVCYYKLTTSGGTTAQTPCFAVVDDISQYSDTEFEDVFNENDEKWYKLNNLNQYEEYGVYGSGRTITYYDGKLTIDEEITPSPSRLPSGYTEVEYVESSGSQYIDTGVYINTSNFEVGYTIIGDRGNWGYVHQNNGNGAWVTVTEYAFFGRFGSSYMVDVSSYLTSGENTIVYTQSGVTVNGTTLTKNLNLSGTDNLNASPLIFFAWYDFNRSGIEYSFNSKFKSFYVKNNGELVRNFVPAKRDSDNKYGMYDLVTDTFYTSPNGNNFSGGSEVTPPSTTATCEFIYSGNSWVNVGEVSGATYPIYYTEKSDPPNNLSFSSMTEAESYQCPWVGMEATIDGVGYVFSGDSISGYEWVMNEPIDYSVRYLTLVAETDGVSYKYDTYTSSNRLQYSTDSGTTWNELANGSSTSSVNTGDKVLFKASGLTVNGERGLGRITPSASASVEGNIMSLAYGDNFSGQTEIPNNFQFRKLFSGVTTITSAENMVLPATTIKKQCYSQMFQGCSNLVTAPKVIGSSAMTWSGDYCWSDMFNSCTSLVNAPQLPALNLGTQCYWYMFQGCTSLTTAPELLATTTATQCYNGMFSGCISLNYIKVMSSNGFNMSEWVKNVASSGTFVKSSTATFSSCGQNTYPCNWTVQNA